MDFQQTEPGPGLGKRYAVFLHPKQEVTVQNLEIQFELPLPPDAQFFANGYQSWSESRLMQVTESIPKLRALAMRHLGYFGDAHIPGIPRGRGQLHSWTYTYLKSTGLLAENKGADTLFLGSLNERTGFTLFLYDQASGILTVRKDMTNLALRHSFPALDFWAADGAEQTLFDHYFQLAEIKAPGFPPSIGWTSWYQHYTQISEPILLENLESFAAQMANMPSLPEDPSPVFQIDDGWQTALGDWLGAKPEFPGGMRHMALKIKEKGLKPGLWLAPFVVSPKAEIVRRNPDWVLKDAKGKPLRAGWNPMWGGWFYVLDFYHKGVREHLSGVFHMVLDKWGFELLKLDFLYAVALAPPPGKTRGGVMWEAMEFIRHLMGKRALLACGVPLGAAFGLADYCRIGGDVHLSWKNPALAFLRHRERVDTLSSLRSTLGRWQLNGRAFQNDPDVFILRTENQKLLPEQQQTLLTINVLLGSLLFTSDNLDRYAESQKAELEEALLLRDRRINAVREIMPDVWVIQFTQDGGRWSAYCNLTNAEKTLTLAKGSGLELRPFETMVLKS